MQRKQLLLEHPWTDSIDLETLPLLSLKTPVKKGVRFYGEGVKNRENRIGIFEPMKKSSAPRIAIDRNAFLNALLKKVENKVTMHYNCEVKKLIGNTNGSLFEHDIKGIVYTQDHAEKRMEADLVVDASGSSFALRYAFASCLGEKVVDDDIFSAYKTMRKLTSEEALNTYKNGELMTTKNNSILHGYGLKSVKRIVDRYEGEMEYYQNIQLLKKN